MPIRSADQISISSAAEGEADQSLSERATRGARAAVGAVVAPLDYQYLSNWCWAACARMVAGSYAIGLDLDSIPSQASIVTTVYGGPYNLTLDGAGIWELYTVRTIGGVRINCTWLQSPCTQGELDDQLDRNAPVQVGLVWAGGAHVVLVVGVDSLGGDKRYLIHDPAYGERIMGFNALLAYWQQTFTDFSR